MGIAEVGGLVVALVAAGALTGFLAGIFGVGGGSIIVPILYEVFRLMDVPDSVNAPLCVGTSLAIIIPTSIQSVRAHLKKGAVDMAILRSWAIPVLIGVVAGSVVASHAPASVFRLVFVGVATITAARMLFGGSWRLGENVPEGWQRSASGFIIGICSVLMGIGGGQISNLYLALYGVAIHRAVATSAGVGVLIALPGTLGYIISGWGVPGLPPFSLGYISLLGLVAFVPLSVLAAPYGASVAHRMPKRRLEIAFGIFLLAVSARFVIALVS